MVTENRILRSQINGRLRLTDPERISLAEIGRRLGRKALAEVAQIVRAETILGWHRQLMARKFDGSKVRSAPGRAPTVRAIEELVLQMVRETRTWGYRRIVRAMGNLGHVMSHQTVANLLKRHSLAPAPERAKQMPWKEFIRSHQETLASVDFFTVEVWTAAGSMTTYVLVFMRIAPRQIHIAGITLAPTEEWMKQIARNLTMVGDGLLNGCRHLLHDRESNLARHFAPSCGRPASNPWRCAHAVQI